MLGQHTPGPWEIDTHAKCDGRLFVQAERNGAHVALCDGISATIGSREELVANARLVAAAPDLLEACLAAQEGTGDWRAVVDMAIARATGNTPQGTAAAVAVALGRSPTEPGTARLAADLEAAEDRAPSPGMVIVADWAGGDAQRMRLVSRYEHPAGNGWRVNIYDHRAKRFCKIEQSVSDQTVEAALLAGRVE